MPRDGLPPPLDVPGRADRAIELRVGLLQRAKAVFARLILPETGAATVREGRQRDGAGNARSARRSAPVGASGMKSRFSSPISEMAPPFCECTGRAQGRSN